MRETATGRFRKFAVWAELLDRLDLRGDERLLDVGCGRGAVLLMAARRLPRGRAVGVDVWSARDQRATPSRSRAATRTLRAWPTGSSCTPPTCASCPSRT